MPTPDATLPSARAKQVFAVTLFVEDLDATEQFYHDVFGMPLIHKDRESVAYHFPNLVVNLLRSSAAPELIAPARVGSGSTPARMLLTLQVDDVDDFAGHLRAIGVPILNGPLDRPWGPRTVTIADPSGHCWEFSS